MHIASVASDIDMNRLSEDLNRGELSNQVHGLSNSRLFGLERRLHPVHHHVVELCSTTYAKGFGLRAKLRSFRRLLGRLTDVLQICVDHDSLGSDHQFARSSWLI